MQYLIQNWELVLRRAGEHAAITGLSLAAALVIALPLGWLLHRRRALAGPVLGALGVIYTIPSIALIILLIPFFGLNETSVMAALVLYCQVILVRNALAGLDGIDPAAIEAARGMGMTPLQVATRVQFPLALPVILAGVRVTAVVSVAIVALGAKFGAGGLGTFLFEGIAQSGRVDKIWLGGVSVALLALAFSGGLLWLERMLAPYRRLRGE